MSAPSHRIRIATYNVHGCVGTDHRHDPERVSRVIAELDADVVALQEYTYPADVAHESRTLDALRELELYQCALGPTRSLVPRGTRKSSGFGNVVLTRHPIREVERIDLSFSRREPRGALAVTIDLHGAELHVIATHLGLNLRERRFQIDRLLSHFDEARAGFAAITGDFNDWLPGRSVVHALDQRFGAPPRHPTFPSFFPLLMLDRIWVHPGAALRHLFVHRSPLARSASDHLPLVAELELPETRPNSPA